MVKINEIISDEANMILEIAKAQNKFKNKSEALEYVIRKFARITKMQGVKA